MLYPHTNYFTKRYQHYLVLYFIMHCIYILLGFKLKHDIASLDCSYFDSLLSQISRLICIWFSSTGALVDIPALLPCNRIYHSNQNKEEE